MRPARSQAAFSRRAAIAALGAAVAGPAHAQLFGTGSQKPAAQTPPPVPPGLQTVVPRGYSERFIKVRDLIAQGDYDDAFGRFKPAPKPDPAAKTDSGAPPAQKPPGPIVSDPFLANVEMGLIAFEGGHPDEAAERLHDAEDVHTEAATATGGNGIKKRLADAGRTILGKASGQEELAVYHPLDHELILQLNYLALSRLLKGESACYNITRRCIEQQDDLKAKFDKQIEDYKAKYDKQLDDYKAQQAKAAAAKAAADQKAGATAADPAKPAASNATLTNLSDQFNAYDDTATRVPNAYVNPLGDYLAGVIQEIVSLQEPSLRDNSRIAYLNAAKLCGRSAQLSAAAAAMARPRVPPKERVLHVVVGEGFAPERDVMTFGLVFSGQVVPIRVPIFKPVPSAVSRIVAQTPAGATLATLEPIGDFEAIRLRDQHDRIPEIMLGVLTSFLASYFEGRVADHLGLAGMVLHAVRDATASPDTRSWLSLPRRFHVGRIALPPKVQSLNLVSFGDDGRRIASRSIAMLPTERQSIVYGRATDGGLQVREAQRLWIDGKLEETAA